jgi:hypothetical protein
MQRFQNMGPELRVKDEDDVINTILCSMDADERLHKTSLHQVCM